MDRSWKLHPKIVPSEKLRDSVGGHPLVAQLLAQRGIETPEAARAFLDPTCYTPAPPDALIGVAEAAELLHDALVNGRNILVWGDFDVDGQTSTSLLVAGLQRLTEPERVRFHVPNRFTESHGIRPPSLQSWLDDASWQPHLLISCDTGIADAEAVTLAKAHGLTVIITDHHDLSAEFEGLTPGVDPVWGQWPQNGADHGDGEHLPAPSVRHADAIVNPKLQPPDDPLRTLPGVGVAYKLMQQLYRVAGCAGDEAELLDLVALGIVADVAEQVHDARYLLQLGLEQLQRTRRTGLLALMDVSRVPPASVTTDAIGFQIGPRMNALGRLEDATVSVELLTTRDAIRAGQLAAKLERLNQQRRLLTSQITGAALEMIDRTPQLLDYNALVLAHPAWHAGIVGIVASRMVEEFGRPAVLLLNPPGEPARGSARSIDGVDIGASIAECSHLLLSHGGHPGAAGVSLLPENIDAFRRELDRQIELHRTSDGPPALPIDAELRLDDIDLALIGQIERLAPFGNGNPTPQFLSRGLRIVDDRRIGRDGQHRRFTVQQDKTGGQLPVLWFNHNDGELPPEPLDLVYTLNINEYQGQRNVQLMYVASRTAEPEALLAELPSSAAPGESAGEDAAPMQIHDLREAAVSLAELPAPDRAAWYAEGALLPGDVPYAPRTALPTTAETLVLWSIPPSRSLLRWLLETVEPGELYLCGHNSADDTLSTVLRSVAAMSKYALSRDDRFPLPNAAARLNTTIGVIRHSLLWLESRGLITLVEWPEDDVVRLAEGSGREENANRAQLQAELDEQLAEVRAWRRFFRRSRLRELGLG